MGTSALTYEPETYMTRADYRTWAEQQSGGRFERHQGIVVAMPPERAGTVCARPRSATSCSGARVPLACHARCSRTA